MIHAPIIEMEYRSLLALLKGFYYIIIRLVLKGFVL